MCDFEGALCSLLCRTFDSSLAEVCWEEGVRLLAYSPLAMGLLTVHNSLACLPACVQLSRCLLLPCVVMLMEDDHHYIILWWQ